MKVVILLCLSLFQVSRAIPGGWKALNTEDPKVQSLATSCIQEHNAKSNSLFQYKLVKLREAQVQLVAGWQYKLVYDMGQTQCQNSHIRKELADCKLTGDAFETCSVVLWVQPWLKTQQITKNTCQPTKLEKIMDKQDLKWTGMEQKKIDSPQAQQSANVAKFNQKKKPILGGDDHDIGNYGEFQNFKTKYNKKYTNKEEEVKRFTIFRANMKKARKLQFKEKGDAKYGATEFADMSEEEFRKTHLTPRWDIKYDPQAQIADIPKGTFPKNWDWREHGAVTVVKNQGSCGSCWAFSTTGNVEGQWAIKKKKLVSLSEQELVDCDKVDQGCNGGLPVDAYKYIMKLGGLETEREYPYTGEDDKCSFNKTEAKVDISGYLNISSDETEMAAWLYKNGPISIGINAMAMQFYMGGVAHPWGIFCDPKSLDHGVLIVGYGVKKTGFIISKETPFWIIKNSWGSGWGESGYYLLYRGGGVCGVNQMPTSAIVN